MTSSLLHLLCNMNILLVKSPANKNVILYNISSEEIAYGCEIKERALEAK